MKSSPQPSGSGRTTPVPAIGRPREGSRLWGHYRCCGQGKGCLAPGGRACSTGDRAAAAFRGRCQRCPGTAASTWPRNGSRPTQGVPSPLCCPIGCCCCWGAQNPGPQSRAATSSLGWQGLCSFWPTQRAEGDSRAAGHVPSPNLTTATWHDLLSLGGGALRAVC